MRKKLIGIIDYGSGNIFSVSKCLLKLGYDVEVSKNAEKLMSCDGIILPGVGAFGDAVRQLKYYKLDKLVLDYVKTGRTLLGICVGMQLLLEHSREFGVHKGLGLIPGYLNKIKFPENIEYKVPVVGWRDVAFTKRVRIDFGLEKNENASFYFVHSYSAQQVDKDKVAAVYTVGGEKIVAMIRNNNILGVQFHPERSGESGKNFLRCVFN